MTQQLRETIDVGNILNPRALLPALRGRERRHIHLGTTLPYRLNSVDDFWDIQYQ
jgi:hypothetical protein